jgi:hypothetical protein
LTTYHRQIFYVVVSKFRVVFLLYFAIIFSPLFHTYTSHFISNFAILHVLYIPRLMYEWISKFWVFIIFIAKLGNFEILSTQCFSTLNLLIYIYIQLFNRSFWAFSRMTQASLIVILIPLWAGQPIYSQLPYPTCNFFLSFTHITLYSHSVAMWRRLVHKHCL